MALHKEKAQAPSPQVEMVSVLVDEGLGCSSGLGVAVIHGGVPSW